MRISILTFDGFNEIDSFVPLNILNRVPGWKAEISAPSRYVRSANGVQIEAQQLLEVATEADAVLVGSGRLTRQIVEDRALMSRIKLDPKDQLIGSQCSGALILAKLGLLHSQPACTDRATRPFVEAAGVKVLHQPFFCAGHVATAGGCLAAHYLAAWVICQLQDRAAAERALEYVVPVGEEVGYISRALETVEPFVGESSARAGG